MKATKEKSAYIRTNIIIASMCWQFICKLTLLAWMIFAPADLTPNVSAQSIAPDDGRTFYTVSGNVNADGANLADATVVLLLD